MFVVKKQEEHTLSLPAKEIKQASLQAMSSELANRVLKALAAEPKFPKQIAKELKEHEQKVYYHIKNLEQAGIIRVVKQESRQGAVANFYSLTEPAFVLAFAPFQPTQKIMQLREQEKSVLEPFVMEGKLNATIIVGSPDPHGPDKARSRDGYYGIDFGLFLGTFLNYVPKLHVKLDTETREEDLQDHLIVLGGPITNKIMERFNDKLPISFDQEENRNIRSKITNNVYASDESGIIVKTKNPLAKNKELLVIAGKRHMGTRAAIIAFLQNFAEICEGNTADRKKIAKVVEGVDLDSDGIVDAVEFRE